jgi:hypothetical protein
LGLRSHGVIGEHPAKASAEIYPDLSRPVKRP